jgi:hypothetical protein
MYNPPPIPQEKRDIAREVALTYRRVGRAAKAAGASPPEYQEAAVDAAIRKYQEIDPDAPADRREASAMALLMIANAINANTNWFWNGPDV